MNHKINLYKSDLPYPQIKVMGKNKYYALLLKEDYVGMVSEMTAINQYLYHYFVNNDNYKDIAHMLEQISIVEMTHLEILAKLIILLGEKPIYYSNNSFWNGSYVDYGSNILEQLKSDLESEYKAIDNYNNDILKIDDPYIKDILKRIILDEEIHVELFKEAILKLK